MGELSIYLPLLCLQHAYLSRPRHQTLIAQLAAHLFDAQINLTSPLLLRYVYQSSIFMLDYVDLTLDSRHAARLPKGKIDRAHHKPRKTVSSHISTSYPPEVNMPPEIDTSFAVTLAPEV